MKIESRYISTGTGRRASLARSGDSLLAAAAGFLISAVFVPLVAPSAHVAFADESVAPGLRFDAGEAKALGSVLAGGDSRQLDVKVEKLDGAAVAIVLPGFRFGPLEGSGLTARAMVRAAIPVDVPRGRYPAALSASVPLSVSKDLGVSFGAGLRATLLALPVDAVNVARARDVTISSEKLVVEQIQSYSLGDAEVRTRFCGGGSSDGLLTVDLALSAERENASGNVVATPFEGTDLRIVVSAAGTFPCT